MGLNANVSAFWSTNQYFLVTLSARCGVDHTLKLKNMKFEIGPPRNVFVTNTQSAKPRSPTPPLPLL